MVDLLPSVDRLVAALDREHRDARPRERLEAAAVLASELHQLGERLLDHYVHAARAADSSWSDIGDVLGVSKQGAHQRYGAPGEPWPAGFSAAGQRVVALAVDDARALGHQYLGTEHLLLALFGPEAGLAARALAALGLTRDQLEASVVEHIGRGRVSTGSLGVTPRTKRAFEAARREAKRLGRRRPEPEHLLLALFSVPRGVACELLEQDGVTEERARAALADLLADDRPNLAQRIRRPKRRLPRR
jgi:hypothetical protein